MLVLPAEITHVQANTCLDMLVQAARADKEPLLLIDATTLTRFDSSALAVLLACRRDALHDGKTFAVRGQPPRLRELAALYGILALLDGPADALAHAPADAPSGAPPGTPADQPADAPAAPASAPAQPPATQAPLPPQPQAQT